MNRIGRQSGEYSVQQVTAVSSQSANSSCSVEDSVEVLSVIRYNKLKMSAPPSTLHSISGSDTASIMSQVPALPAQY